MKQNTGTPASRSTKFAIWIGFGLLCLLCYQSQPIAQKGMLWYSVIPPLLAVCLALVTHKIVTSLFAAIIAGGALATLSEPFSLASLWKGATKSFGYLSASVVDEVNLLILGFVMLVISMIAVIIVSGGMQAVVNRLMSFAKTKRSTQTVTGLMGLILFFDDYANTMIVGQSLRPLTDKRRISREKLAFLVDATSAPIAGIAILSTWIGYEVGLFSEISQTLSLGRDGYAMFFDALGFRFYCILMIVFIFANAISGQDFGPMRRAQERAQTQNKLFADDAVVLSSASGMATSDPKARQHIASFLLPMLVLFVTLGLGIWMDGASGRGAGASIFSLTTWRDTLAAGQNSTAILARAAGLGLLMAVLCALSIARLNLPTILRTIWSGIKTSLVPLSILVLAWSLKNSCSDLGTGTFLAGTLKDVVSPIWFPAILFAISAATSFATGTSWGTMAILIPTSIPVAFQLDGGAYGLVTMISLGAILDGSIFGDHCSPLSDTTIMSSTASSCDHIHHVQTQIPYSLTVATIAVATGYIPAAMGGPSWISLVLGSLAIVGLFVFLSFRNNAKEVGDLNAATSSA